MISMIRVALRGKWTYLGDRLVVDVDQLPGVGVDLERAVEAQRGLDVICACTKQSAIHPSPSIKTR